MKRRREGGGQGGAGEPLVSVSLTSCIKAGGRTGDHECDGDPLLLLHPPRGLPARMWMCRYEACAWVCVGTRAQVHWRPDRFDWVGRRWATESVLTVRRRRVGNRKRRVLVCAWRRESAEPVEGEASAQRSFWEYRERERELPLGR